MPHHRPRPWLLLVHIALGCATPSKDKPNKKRTCCVSNDNSIAGDNSPIHPNNDVGTTTNPQEPESNPDNEAEVTDCEETSGPSTAPLRRLTRLQQHNTYRDLALAIGDVTVGADLYAAVVPVLENMPSDGVEELRRLDHSVSQDHVIQQYYAARAFGTALVASDETLQAVVGSCATNGDSADDTRCMEDFVDWFTPLAYRRPITDEERSFLTDEVYNTGTDLEEGLQNLVTVALSSPAFVYHLEVDGEAVSDTDDLTEISSYELANRLSYTFWQTMPDAALFAAAANGSLTTDEGYQDQVDRVFSDPRTAATLDDFFEQWLQLDALPEMDNAIGDPRFDAFVGDFPVSSDTRENMIRDTLDLTRHVVWDSDGALDDLFLNQDAFATTEDIAALYGDIPLRDLEDAPAPLPTADRPGILTRPAMVASGSAMSHPILKGVFIRRRILCDELGAPPADLGVLPDVPAESSAREHAEILTEREGTGCVYCHQNINGLGFATENFDALGRSRTSETIYDDDGNRIAVRPVNTQSIPSVTPGDTTVSSDAHDLMALLLETGKVEQCVARFWFRFSFARTEDLGLDACALAALEDSLRNGAPLGDALKSVAMLPEFRLRRH